MTKKHELLPETITEIRNDFKFFDRDNNSKIDVKEFTELLKVISPDATPEQAQNGFAMVDENNDGYIDFNEFIEWWQTCWWEY